MVGIVVFFLISLVETDPRVSIPKLRGVTSSNNTSLTSPCMTPAWMDAPTATASSGFTSFLASTPKISFTLSCTFGILVCPPTRITSEISPLLIPASFIAVWQGSTVLSIKSATSDSSFARVNLTTKCLGPDESAVI